MARPAEPARTCRFSVTLTEFTVFELDSLVGPMGPTRAQVTSRIVEEWLLSNVEKIEHLRERHSEFRKQKESRKANRARSGA